MWKIIVKIGVTEWEKINCCLPVPCLCLQLLFHFFVSNVCSCVSSIPCVQDILLSAKGANHTQNNRQSAHRYTPINAQRKHISPRCKRSTCLPARQHSAHVASGIRVSRRGSNQPALQAEYVSPGAATISLLCNRSTTTTYWLTFTML